MRRRLALVQRHMAPAAAETAAADFDATWAAAAGKFSSPDAPVNWNRGDWAAMEKRQREQPLLRQEQLDALVNEAAFLRDGVLVLPGVLTDQATASLTSAMAEAQALQDAFVSSDWRWINWAGLGAAAPPPQIGLTPDQQASALGNSQAVSSGTPGSETGVPLLRRMSVVPEYFPPGHQPFLMEAMTHPEMLSLHSRLLGGDSVRFDHSQLFTRPAGHSGSAWHSHVIGGDWDEGGAVTPEEYRAMNNVVFSIVYPQGFTAGSGALKVVPGSHLFREVFNLGSTDDEAVLAWIGSHPSTDTPLAPQTLSLPPGSVVCLMAHAAHAVEPRPPADDAEPRWGCLFAYRSGEETYGRDGTPPSPGREVPPLWAHRAAQGRLPPALTELLKGTGVFYPHWAKDAYTSPGHLPHAPGDLYSGPGGTFHA